MAPSLRGRPPSSADRFLGISSCQTSPLSTASAGGDLYEHDVLWSGAVSAEPPPSPHRHRHHGQSSPSASVTRSPLSKGFAPPESFGILAALPEDDDSPRARRPHPIFHHKPSISSSSSSFSSSSSSTSSSRMVPAIPRPPIERQASLSKKFHQSAPVNVPVLAKAARHHRGFEDIDNDDSEEEDGEWLPPHEIAERSYARAPVLSTSVLEGVGRTLKGRDLRRVRNAVWRKTEGADENFTESTSIPCNSN